MFLAGCGILISSMQVLSEEDADFNEWFDKEHLPERVAITGFLDARRYESVDASKRYFQVYNTVDFEVLDGAEYQKVLANQTDWSKHHIPKFIRPTRVVGRLVASEGFARGAAITVVRVRPHNEAHMLPALQGFLGLLDTPGVTSVHFVEGDAELSKPVMQDEPYVGSEDAYIIIECSSVASAVQLAGKLDLPVNAYGELVNVATYRFRLDMNAPRGGDTAG